MLQGAQALDHSVIVAMPFIAGCFDRAQNCAQSIHQVEQGVDNLGSCEQLAVAQQAQQVFASVRQRLKPRIT